MAETRKPKAPKPVKRGRKPAARAGTSPARSTRRTARPKTGTRGRPRKSHADAEARRRQILAAALKVFSEHGFEAARLDDVAKKAKVAKGTLYLYFSDKQSMFEALVHSATQPILGNLATLSSEPDVPADILLRRLFTLFRQEVLATERKLVLRLVIAEGPRFPEIAAFYHREIISRVMAVLQKVAQHAWQNGQLATDGPVRFPQLIAAPLLLSLIWDSLFARIAPLDVEQLLSAHTELLTSRRTKR